mmetsp:Transcript_77857/g.196579  ORF Transcript_77857/g.196579 Transcript_77857/m.196579 type:complete len:207 (-) Transcript_77857:160-780(-)
MGRHQRAVRGWRQPTERRARTSLLSAGGVALAEEAAHRSMPPPSLLSPVLQQLLLRQLQLGSVPSRSWPRGDARGAGPEPKSNVAAGRWGLVLLMLSQKHESVVEIVLPLGIPPPCANDLLTSMAEVPMPAARHLGVIATWPLLANGCVLSTRPRCSILSLRDAFSSRNCESLRAKICDVRRSHVARKSLRRCWSRSTIPWSTKYS